MICELCKCDKFWGGIYPTDLKPFILRAFRTCIRLHPLNAYRSFRGVIKGLKIFKHRNILICDKCELGVVYPKISERELTKYYKKDYWVSQGKLEPCINNRTISTYKLLSPYLENEVLEFGSASAQLSRYFKSKADIQCDCVDLGLKWKKELSKYVRHTYSNINSVKGKYNLIMGSHSLEHVLDLEDYMTKFINLLKPKGYLYFEVPNSEEQIVFIKDFHFPHTYFFTPKSFKQIAKKFKLKIVFVKTFSQSYTQRFDGRGKNITSLQENPKGAYLRVLFQNGL